MLVITGLPALVTGKILRIILGIIKKAPQDNV